MSDQENQIASRVVGEDGLPVGWRWASVDEVIEQCQYGSSAKTHEEPTGVPVLRMGNIQNGCLDLTDLKYLPTDHAEFPNLLLTDGDLLFNRTNSAELVGKSAVYHGVPSPCSYASYLVALRTGAACDPNYLCYFLNSHHGRMWVRSVVSQQVGQANVNSTKLRALRFPLAPLNEQRRIVAKLEELLSNLDAGIVALKRAKANLKRYRASVLRAAVEGRLTAEWRAKHPHAEPVADLLKRTPPPPRPNRWGSRSQDVIPGHPALSVGHVGTDLPPKWAWSPLVDVARMETGHTPSRSHPEWWDGEVHWIGIADAREHHGGVIHETAQRTNEAGIANSAARLLPAGTVCVSRTASVGYVVVMGREMATSQDFVNWIPTPAVTSEWLRIVFLADREALLRFGKGSVHKTIYFPEWLSTHVAIPPLEEQHAITEEVDTRLSQLAASERTIELQLARSARLRQSLLKRAFEGKIVPQDPADEPASVLLERIRAGRQPVGGNGVASPKARRPRKEPR